MFWLCLIFTFDFINGDFLENLYRKYVKKVYAIAFSNTNNKEDAEDIVQEVFINIWKSIDRFKDIDEEATKYLIVKYTKNKATDFYRKKMARINPLPLTNDEDTEYDIAEESQNPEKLLLDKEGLDKLISHIETLPENQREILEMKYGYQMSNKDIAEILSLKIEVVNSRIYRAKRSLEKLIGGEN